MSNMSWIDQQLMEKVNEYNHNLIPSGDNVIINKMYSRNKSRVKGVMVGIFFKDIEHELFKNTLFVGWSMCRNDEVCNKVIGRKMACIRAVRLARTYLNDSDYCCDYFIPSSMMEFSNLVLHRLARIVKNGTIVFPALGKPDSGSYDIFDTYSIKDSEIVDCPSINDPHISLDEVF